MKIHFILTITWVIAFVTFIGCGTQKEVSNLTENLSFMLGTVTYPDPSITNHFGGLTVYKKKKGKIYNKEKIPASTSDIGGISVVEEDPIYYESIRSGMISNAWTYSILTNDGTRVKFLGDFDNIGSWEAKDDDAFLEFVTDLTKLSPEEYVAITNYETSVFIYRTLTLDEKTSAKYDRISTVTKSSVINRSTAIQAFNDILTGLKRQ